MTYIYSWAPDQWVRGSLVIMREGGHLVMNIRDLNRDELVGLAQRTFEKNEWTQDDLRILRACWREFEERGGENAVMFFRPAFFGILKVHEIETGEVDEEFIRTLEPSQIARDYREIIRKLEQARSSDRVHTPIGEEQYPTK
jgi:hypothetical protein